MNGKKRIGELLVERGLLTEEALSKTLETKTARIGENLVEKGLVSKEDIGAALQSIMGVPYVECPPAEIDPKVLQLVPAAIASKRCVLPLSVEENPRTLIVVMAEPQNVAHISELEFCSGMKISPRFSFRTDVLAGIKRYYGEPAAWGEPAAKTSAKTPFVCSPIPESAEHQSNPGYRASVIATFAIALVGGWASGFLLYQSRHASKAANPPAIETAVSEPTPGTKPIEALPPVPKSAYVTAPPAVRASPPSSTGRVSASGGHRSLSAPERNSPTSSAQAADRNPTPSSSPAADRNPTPSSTPAADRNPAPSSTPAADRNPTPSSTPAADRNPAPSSTPAADRNPAPPSTQAADRNPAPPSTPAADNNPTPSSAQDDHRYTLRVGVFRSMENAERLTRSLSETHEQTRMVPLSDNLYSVNVGSFEDRATANQRATEIANEFQLSPLVVRSAP